MANKELFKQAIAEAKSVREAAIANAKIAMEESLTPHLKELLAQRLAEMEEAEEMEEEKVHMEEEAHEEVYAEAEEAHEEEEVEEEESEEAEDDSEESEDEAKEESEEDEEIEDMTVEDLKELIRDILTQEMQDMPEEEEEMENMEAEEEEIDMVSADDEEINIDEILAELAEMEDEDHIEETEEEVAEGLKDKLKALYNDPEVLGKLITVDGKKMSLKDFLAMAGGATAGSMAGGGQATTKTPGSGVAEAEDSTEELDEALETIEQLRKDLNEVNLLNAKLLYVNKIFKANNLDESQKVGIIAAFDKAETVKEAKLVFESVSTNIAPKKSEVVKEHKSFASKSAGVAPNREVISESSDIVKRMQKLAGII